MNSQKQLCFYDESLELILIFQELQGIRILFHLTTVFLQNLKNLSQKTGKGVFQQDFLIQKCHCIVLCSHCESSCEGSSQASCWTGFTTAKHTALPHTYSYGVLQ